MTFTRAARDEALSRTGRTEDEFPYLRTIHAICYRQLSIAQDQIVRPRDLRNFGKIIGAKLTGGIADPWIEEFERGYEPPTRDDLLLSINHSGRHRKILLKEALVEGTNEIDFKYARWFTKAYHAWKEQEGMLDYTDLLQQYLEHGQPLDVDVMFVDEAQDLSSLQWDIVRKLGANAERWYIAGDDDQAIFRWAGADASVFQRLDVDKTEILGQSYRVSKAVHSAAMAVVHRISDRLTKEYAPTPSEGEVANAGYLQSLAFDNPTFVLFRNHYRGSELARQLKQLGVPFIGYGSPLQNADVRDALLAWARLHKKGHCESKIARKLLKFSSDDFTNPLARHLVKSQPTVSLSDLFIRVPDWREWAHILPDIPGRDYIDLCVRRAGFWATAKPRTELLSIHQSKGREAHTVMMDTEMSRATWEASLKNPDDEHRVWYVGVTRAKERAFFLLPDGQLSYRM